MFPSLAVEVQDDTGENTLLNPEDKKDLNYRSTSLHPKNQIFRAIFLIKKNDRVKKLSPYIFVTSWLNIFGISN